MFDTRVTSEIIFVRLGGRSKDSKTHVLIVESILLDE